MAAEAYKQMPEGSLDDQVALATRLNIYSTIAKVLRFSEITRSSVLNVNELQIHGAVYDIKTGEVEWMGEHPDLQEIIGAKLSMHAWKRIPYMPRRLAHMADEGELVDGSALAHIARLKKGNQRFQRGDSAIAKPHRSSATSRGAAADPFAIVMGPAETLVPIEAVIAPAVPQFPPSGLSCPLLRHRRRTRQGPRP